MAVCAALCHAQGNVKGDIIDTSTGEALPFVNVAVYNRTTGEFVKGAVSDAEGAFNVTGLPYGQYTLKLSYIGYTTVTGEFALTERRRHANMKTMTTNASVCNVIFTSGRQRDTSGDSTDRNAGLPNFARFLRRRYLAYRYKPHKNGTKSSK